MLISLDYNHYNEPGYCSLSLFKIQRETVLTEDCHLVIQKTYKVILPTQGLSTRFRDPGNPA